MAKRVEDFEEDVINQEARVSKKPIKKSKAEAESQELTEEAKAELSAAKFDEKCKSLLQIAKKKKNVLD